MQESLPGFPPGGRRVRQSPKGLGDAALVPLPEDFAGDWEGSLALGRLGTLCRWLDQRLGEAVRVVERAGIERRVEVFGAMAYVVRWPERHLRFETCHDESWQSSPEPCEIGHPLSDAGFLEPVMASLGLWAGEKQEPYIPQGFATQLNQWVAGTAYRLLRLEPRFQALRRRLIPDAVGLPHDLVAIARASRARPKGPLLQSNLFNLVWSHEARFRRVAQECPGLLPLLAAYVLDTGDLPPGADAIQALKAAIRRAGLGEAAWRYVARHGARLLRVPWRMTGNQSPWEVACIYMRLLERAGLPAPPPPVVVRGLLHSRSRHNSAGAVLDEGLLARMDSEVLRSGLLVAHRRRSDCDLADFVDELLGVCIWSESHQQPPDRNQAKSGWPWFVRRWREAEAVDAAVSAVVARPCRIRHGVVAIGRHLVVPLDTTEALVREAFAMRNSLRSYQEECVAGTMEVYSVREQATGKRVACIGFQMDKTADCLLMTSVMGYANSKPSQEVTRVAEVFLRLLFC